MQSQNQIQSQNQSQPQKIHSQINPNHIYIFEKKRKEKLSLARPPPGVAGRRPRLPPEPARAGRAGPREAAARWAWPRLLRLAGHPPAPVMGGGVSSLLPPAPVPGGGSPGRARLAARRPRWRRRWLLELRQ